MRSLTRRRVPIRWVAALLLVSPSAVRVRVRAAYPSVGSPMFAGSWVGTIGDPVRGWRIRVDAPDRSDADAASVDFLDVDGYGRVFTLTRDSTSFRLVRAQPTGNPIVFAGRVASDSAFGAWSGLNKTIPFVLHRTAVLPPPVVSDTIGFDHGTVHLAGTLVLPSGAGPFPAVVEIHGGGPDSRGKYESKAIFLARHGFATLIYDKRGVGGSTGDWQTATMEDLAGDALAGVAYLRRRSDIDRHRIGVEGFSQGGWIAPLAASLDARVAFVVVGSAAGINPMAQSLFQVGNEMRAAGEPDSIIALALTLRRRLYAAPRGPARRALSSELATYKTQPWFPRSSLPDSLADSVESRVRVFIHFEPLPTWRRVHVPVLAYWGEADIHLPAARSCELIRAALAHGGNRDFSSQVYPGADHGMSKPTSPETSVSSGLPRLYPSYDLIADWLVSRFGTPQTTPIPQRRALGAACTPQPSSS
jgi:dienelactone hydrolase